MEIAKSKPLPVLVVRLTSLYAWIVIGAGIAFLFVALVFARFNLFLAAVSIAMIIGGDYWRRHLHVVARLTPEQLILRREGAIDWTEIASVEKQTLRLSRRQLPRESEFACITLRQPSVPGSGVQGAMARMKRAVTGYDIVVPGNELECTVEYFVAECHKRMGGGDG